MAASTIDIHATTPGRRLAAGLLTLWLLFSPTGLVFAGPVADAAAIASQQPTVTTSPTGVAMVNITAPNSAGLSYNRYQRFDVDPTGLLLNNSTTPQPTPLGPIIPANANLGGRSASLIVNEVVTAIPSQLNGPLAVLGDQAKVVIANPNGISCNGCSFLNTPQVQLSTGSIGFRDAGGTASSFDAATGITLRVDGGQVRIDGAGLSSFLARLDIIAETISTNGPVTVTGALNLLAGRQTVDAESLAVLATGAGNSKAGIGQDWAVDATAFGAMNAGSIRIIATPAGMGVRSAAQMAASGGDLAINVNGDLTLANAAASRDVMLSAAGAASNGGQIVAGRNLALSAASLDNRNQVIAALGGDITLSTSGTVDNSGGIIAASNGLSLTTPSLDNTGGLLQAGGKLSLVLPGSSFDLSGTQAGILAAGGEMAIQAGTLANSGSFGHTGALSLTAVTISNTGLLAAQGAVTLAADTIVNDGTLAAGTTLAAQATTSVLNTGTWAAGGDAALTTANLSNTGTISSNGKLTFAAPTFTNSGQIIAAGDLALAATTGFTNSGVVAAGNDAAFTLGSSASNAGGLLTAGNDLTLATSASGNFGGILGANRDLILQFAGYTNGAGETAFLAGRNLTVTADNLTNAGTLAAPHDLTITTTGALDNTGLLLAGRDAAFTVGGTFSNAGIVETGRDLSLSAAALSNGSGASTVQSWGQSTNMADYRAWVLTQIDDPVIQGKLFNEITPDWQQYNSRFYLLNRWSYFMDSGLEGPYFSLSITRHNTDASLSAGRNLTASITGTLANNAALITAGNELTLSAATFQNLAAQDRYEGVAFAGGGGHTLVAYANSASTVQAGGNVSITAPTQTNTGTIQGSSVYLGGALTNGLTDYNQPTPATTLPHAVIDLTWAPTGLGAAALPGATFTPAAPALFSSAAQLSLLAPVGQHYLDSLLPESLRNSTTPFLMDAWLEQQALRQAALRETGQAAFLSGLAYDEASGLSVDSQQRALLYQNAARFATENDIRLGVALSEAQQAKLAEPILWYVEESVTGPDGKSYAALVPKLYLPEGPLGQWANVAGGVIRGQDVSLDAGTGRIENTGYIVAGNTLSVDAGELVNRARSAAWGSFTMEVEGGLLEVWGDRVQPGGFLSAAKLDLNVGRVESISGEFLEGGVDISGELASRLGSDFSRSVNRDNTHTLFHADVSIGLEQLVIMAVAIAVSIYTAGAASGAIAAAAESSAVAAGTVAAGSSAATAVGTAAASSAWGMAASSAAGAMASSAVTGALSGNFSLDNVLKSGLTAGLTAGLTNAPLFDGQSLNQWANVQSAAGNITGTFNPDTFGQNLAGMAGRGLVNAGVNTAIYGGSFDTAFTNSFVNDLAAVGANAVGMGTQSYTLENVAGHAGVGAAAAWLREEDAVAGAIGGATGALVSPWLIDATTGDDMMSQLSDPSRLQSATVTALSMLAGGVVSNALGHDSIIAAQAAQNEALNNALLHKTQLDKLRQQCGSSSQGACGIIQRVNGSQTVDLGVTKGPWQIIAQVDAQGTPLAYSAYNTVSKEIDFIMDPQDLRGFMQSNTPTMLVSSGYYYIGASTPVYQQQASSGAVNVAAGITGGDGALAKQGVGDMVGGWAGAAQDPGWWLATGLAVTGGVIASTPAGRLVVAEGVGTNSESTFSYYMQQARTLNVSTSENASVFYSGPRNRALAEQFANMNGRTTLEMTAGGSWLDAQKLFSPNSPLSPAQATQVWSTLSERFAAGASGNAVGFTQGARAGSTFNTVEFPTLQKNPNVTNVLTGGN